MTAPELTIETRYGRLTARIWAGPSFGRDADAPTVGATVLAGEQHNINAPDGYTTPTLTLNGIPYRATGYFALTADGWREEYGGRSPLARTDVLFGGDPTDAARKVWRETISPAILAALTTATAEILGARIAALRAEADRLAAL